MNIDRALAPRLVSRAFAAGLLLTPFVMGQVPAAAPSPNQIGAGRPEWGAETREEHAARIAGDQKSHPTLEIGSRIPDFRQKGSDGQFHSILDYDSRPVLAVVFICNHCAASQIYEGRIKKFVEDYKPKGVQVVAIQPNDPQAVLLRELNYTDLGDSYESMVLHAEYRHFTFLYDGAAQEVVAKFGPKVTSYTFVFDKDLKLRFEGRIDDNLGDRAKSHETRNTLDAVLSGQLLAVDHTPHSVAIPGGIPGSRAGSVSRRFGMRQPEKLESIAADGLKKLLRIRRERRS